MIWLWNWLFHRQHPKTLRSPILSKGVTFMVSVVIINESTVCTDTEVSSWVPALQKQVSEHFAPLYGADAVLSFATKTATVDPTAWQLVILDNSDQAGALGYHDLTAAGKPLGKVFAASDKQYGNSVSVTTSHELLEILADPGINMTVSAQDNQGNPIFVAYEVADACESDSDGYIIDGILVSDFVYPDWFGGVSGLQYDYCKKLTGPFPTLRQDGYIGIWTPSKGWDQIHGFKAAARYRSRAVVGSRRERRSVVRDRWIPSTAR